MVSLGNQLLKIASLFISLQIFYLGCASPQIKEYDKHITSAKLYINTNPPGAIIISDNHPRSTKEEYVSPADVVITQGYAGLTITKEGYWEEERLILSGVGFRTEEGVAENIGALLYKDGIILWKVINMTQKYLGAADTGNFNAQITVHDRAMEKGSGLEITLNPINPIFLPLFASMGKGSKKTVDQVNAELQKMYGLGKINKEEFLRAKLRVGKAYK